MVQEQGYHRINETIRLCKPYLGDKESLMALLEEVLDSGFLVQGKYVAQFEQEVAAYLRVNHAIAVSSGTAALHLSLIALGIGPGDEVIIPAYTFPATANVVELVGAKPVLVDVDLNTFNIQVEKIEEAISSNTKAIIPVHLFGNPADMDLIIKLANTYGLAVIEDAAGAMGSEYRGKKCGTFGSFGCFSFHPRKIITTGEGGMVATNDDNLAGRVRSLRNHGIKTTDIHHDFITAGFNYRMNEVEAVLGLIQAREIEKIVSGRQKLAGLYMDFLQGIPGIIFQKTLPNSKTVWQAFVIRFKDRSVDTILVTFQKAGIEANIGTYSIHLLQYYQNKYSYKSLDYPNTSKLHLESLALPFYNNIPPADIKRVTAKLKEVRSKY